MPSVFLPLKIPNNGYRKPFASENNEPHPKGETKLDTLLAILEADRRVLNLGEPVSDVRQLVTCRQQN